MKNFRSIGDLAKIHKGNKAENVFEENRPNAVPYLQIEDLRPNAKKKYTDDSSGFIANVKDVLIAWDGANAGTVSFGLHGFIGSTLAALRLKNGDCETEFIGRFLQSKFTLLRERCTGATIPHIDRNVLESLEILLPLNPEQKRIAAILDKADRLRRQRRFAQTLSDSFLQSVFIKMFGDPLSNRNGYDIFELGDFVESFQGGVNFNSVSESISNEYRVLKISAVTWGEFNPKESKPISRSEEFNDTLIVKKGDLLISRANTTELVGAVCMVRENPSKVVLPDKLWRIKFIKNSSLLPDYTLHLLRQKHLRKVMGDLASGSSGSMKNISKEKTATLPIMLPPLPLQEKFAEIVQKFERVRRQQREATRQAEHLFQTLLHRAFRGKL